VRIIGAVLLFGWVICVVAGTAWVVWRDIKHPETRRYAWRTFPRRRRPRR